MFAKKESIYYKNAVAILSKAFSKRIS